MISLQSYLYNPCGTASIPYWKQKGLIIPENTKIVHARDYTNEAFRDYNDEPYFRLYHNLKDIRQEITEDVEIISGIHDIDEFVQLINASYSDLSVTSEQMESYRRTPVYCSDLWILLKEKMSGIVLGGGIAEFATVSGKVNNPTNPERLYRKCGFTGNDIWHILTLK